MTKEEIENLFKDSKWTHCNNGEGFDYLFQYEEPIDGLSKTIIHLYACKIGATKISYTCYTPEIIEGSVSEGSWALGRKKAIARLKQFYKDLKVEKQND